MMRILAIIAHPRSDSFCHALFTRAVSALEGAGHYLSVHDLYAEDFDPVLKESEAYTAGDSIEKTLAKATDPVLQMHRQEIARAQGLLIVHPNWWGKPPAMLAGWLDRVLVPGVAYRLDAAEGEPEGLLKIESAVILNTSDTPPEREASVLGDPLRLIWENCVLPYCGVEAIFRRTIGPVAGSDVSERHGWLDETDRLVSERFRIA